MGDPEKPFDPKATMQVDAAEVAEVLEPESAARPASARKTPPPLPSSGPRPEARGVDVAPPGAAPASATQRLRFAAIVAAMLAIAAIGGWVFAKFVRGPAPAASVAPSSAEPPQPTAAAPTASEPLTLPPVEIR